MCYPFLNYPAQKDTYMFMDAWDLHCHCIEVVGCIKSALVDLQNQLCAEKLVWYCSFNLWEDIYNSLKICITAILFAKGCKSPTHRAPRHNSCTPNWASVAPVVVFVVHLDSLHPFKHLLYLFWAFIAAHIHCTCFIICCTLFPHLLCCVSQPYSFYILMVFVQFYYWFFLLFFQFPMSSAMPLEAVCNNNHI